MTQVLITGFPGFLASRLMVRLTDFYNGYHFICLVQKKFLPQAEKLRTELMAQHPSLNGRLVLVTGDITLPDAGLEPAVLDRVIQSAEDVWHLAAIYDLAIPREPAYLVNTVGTGLIAGLASRMKNLKHLFYISTAYVSGKRTGTIYEEELSAGQSFRNHYEETKYLAEVEIRKFRHDLPLTIFRPGIIVGHSQTGETQKFDGPYYVIQVMDRLPKGFLMTLLGSGNHTVNLVPVDYCIGAMAWLATHADSAGKVYHLTDPSPLTQREIAQSFSDALGKNLHFLSVPSWLAKGVLSIGPVARLAGLPSVLVDYFDHPHQYDCTNTLAGLEGSGIRCPSFREVSPVLVRYFLEKKKEFATRQALY